jgi:hypothetical protein
VKRAPAWLLWILAVIIMLVTAIYQRRTGPTYPVSGTAQVGGGPVKFSLPRSYDGPDDAQVRIEAPSQAITGFMEFRRFRSRDEWGRQPMTREGDFLVSRIPHQPVAGKVMYRIVLVTEPQAQVPLTAEPLIIRFRDPVPVWVLLPHVLFMFIALLFASRAGLEDWANGPQTHLYSLLAVIALAIGGIILGPLMQKYAFEAYWTGWPFGRDLTDNKTAAALILWIIAYWRLKKKPESRGWAIAALILMLIVYYIPHSVLGSELDYTKTGIGG